MSKTFPSLFMLLTAFSFCLMGGGALAEKSGSSSSLPQRGMLSQSMQGGYISGKVDLPWGEKNGIASDAPITGSMSKVSDREWRMRLFNNSATTYSVDVRVVQRNANGTAVKTDRFSYTLKSKQSTERPVSSTANVTDAQLELLSWRDVTPKKEGQEEAAEQGGAAAK